MNSLFCEIIKAKRFYFGFGPPKPPRKGIICTPRSLTLWFIRTQYSVICARISGVDLSRPSESLLLRSSGLGVPFPFALAVLDVPLVLEAFAAPLAFAFAVLEPDAPFAFAVLPVPVALAPVPEVVAFLSRLAPLGGGVFFAVVSPDLKPIPEGHPCQEGQNPPYHS
jgi:hypothetical protein